jgi:two-component system alkaline phosphatase synthesis response regulator PhoP
MKSEAYKILIVDDESDTIELVSYILEKEGFAVVSAGNGVDGLRLAENESPDLIILDVMMPEMDGMEVCERLRSNQKFADTIITFLTARSEDYSQIAGFEAGADDYITKPVRPKTLVARVKALLKRKRTSSLSSGIVKAGPLTIDPEKRVVLKGSKTLDLPKKEFDLLLLLSSEQGKVFTREYIYRKIWDSDIVVGERTIDVHIRKLRKKIGEDRISTIKGVGYKLSEN